MACWEVSSLSIAGSLANNKNSWESFRWEKKTSPRTVPSVGWVESSPGFSQVRLTTTKVELASTDDHRVLSLGQKDIPFSHLEKNSFWKETFGVFLCLVL